MAERDDRPHGTKEAPLVNFLCGDSGPEHLEGYDLVPLGISGLEDDAELPTRWKFLIDFLSKFHTGPKKSPGPEEPA